MPLSLTSAAGSGASPDTFFMSPFAGYLGVDIIPEIMRDAIQSVHVDPRSSFALGESCAIPKENSSCDIVAGFSVITHLLDEETYDYFVEATRVLRPDGIAIFSFLDFGSSVHADMFFEHAAVHRLGQGDLLKFTTKEVLSLLAARAGFGKCVFVDHTELLPPSGKGSPLIADEKLPMAVSFGQSICVMSLPG
jgi:hypothetical protein